MVERQTKQRQKKGKEVEGQTKQRQKKRGKDGRADRVYAGATKQAEVVVNTELSKQGVSNGLLQNRPQWPWWLPRREEWLM